MCAILVVSACEINDVVKHQTEFMSSSRLVKKKKKKDSIEAILTFEGVILAGRQPLISNHAVAFL